MTRRTACSGARSSVPCLLARQTQSRSILAFVAAFALFSIGADNASAAPERPAIVAKPIPFPVVRKVEMQAYAKRHYGLDRWRLQSPKVIVEHFTASESFGSAYSTFVADVPDQELHELPGTCAH